jgi:hypothetical protein
MITEQVDSRISKAIETNPLGCICMPYKDGTTQMIYWQRPKPKDEVYWLNLVSGVANYALAHTTKAELFRFLDKVLKDSDQESRGDK